MAYLPLALGQRGVLDLDLLVQERELVIAADELRRGQAMQDMYVHVCVHVRA